MVLDEMGQNGGFARPGMATDEDRLSVELYRASMSYMSTACFAAAHHELANDANGDSGSHFVSLGGDVNVTIVDLDDV
ncbi:hypothetical protein ACOQFL_03425 [Actinopolyspora sp. H202]